MKHSTVLSIASATLGALIGLGVPAKAATIAITYSYVGTATGAPIISGSTLTAEHLLSGSILSGNPGLDAALNPVTGQDHDVIDLTTGILDGSLTFLFANGEKLFANQHVVVTDPASTPQTLTFTGGTGAFAAVTGSASGIGSLTSTGYMAAGSGVLVTAAVPEPASATICLAGFALLASGFAARRGKTASA